MEQTSLAVMTLRSRLIACKDRLLGFRESHGVLRSFMTVDATAETIQSFEDLVSKSDEFNGITLHSKKLPSLGIYSVEVVMVCSRDPKLSIASPFSAAGVSHQESAPLACLSQQVQPKPPTSAFDSEGFQERAKRQTGAALTDSKRARFYKPEGSQPRRVNDCTRGGIPLAQKRCIGNPPLATVSRHVTGYIRQEGSCERPQSIIALRSACDPHCASSDRTEESQVRAAMELSRGEAELLEASEHERRKKRAIINFASFHRKDPQDVSLGDVLSSSAGLEGWGSANVPANVSRPITLHARRAEEGKMDVACFDIGGKEVARLNLPTKIKIGAVADLLSTIMGVPRWHLHLILLDGTRLWSCELESSEAYSEADLEALV